MKALRLCLAARFSILLLVPFFTMAGFAQAAAPAAHQTQKNVPNKKPLQAADGASPASPSGYYVCSIIIPATEGGLTADQVKPLLGNIASPYSVWLRDATTLLVYSSKQPDSKLSRPTESKPSEKVEPQSSGQAEPKDECSNDPSAENVKEIAIAIAAGHSRVTEVKVAHGASELLKAIQAVIPGKSFTVTAAGGNRIRIVSAPGVADDDYNKFLAAIERIDWQMKMESPVSRVFYVNTADVTSALGGKGASSSGGSNSSGNQSGVPQTQTDTTTTINQVCLPQGIPGSTPAAGTGTATNATGGTSPAAGTAANSTSGAGKNNPSGQLSTPCVATTPAQADNSSSKSGGGQGSPSVSVSSVNNDLLVFGAQPGQDADIAEKKRLLAALDFPRPEVLLNIWSFQTSSSHAETVANSARALRTMIDAFNDSIQASIDRTWNGLQVSIPTNEIFDPDLYPYLTDQYIGGYVAPGVPAASLYVPTNLRKSLGVCSYDQYCLGYSSLFHPAKPTLTDMLLAVILSANPAAQMTKAIGLMQGTDPELQQDKCTPQKISQSNAFFKRECQNTALTCEAADQFEIAPGMKAIRKLAEIDDRNIFNEKAAEKLMLPDSALPLHCFEAETQREFQDGSNKGVTPRVRLLRAALVNFLFHYKMSQQYPHEFSLYDLSQSAQELNSELNPLIVAFNRDISAMLDVFSEDENKAETRNGIWGSGGHGSTFINNGIITVRTLSGQSTTVDTVTQSVFDATNPPSITDLINSVSSAESNIPGVLKSNLTANEAATIIGALNSVNSAQSKVGREFKINITPRSLSGASSAELQVSLDAKESAEPTLFSNGKSNSDNISRIADHNVNTKVRLESIKLFEISSFSAYLERSRRNFPLIPPVFELPYIGSILSLPLLGAKEFHRSTAVISAVVVPTAIDIVSGIRFNFDRMLASPDPLAEPHLPNSPMCSSTPDGSANAPCILRVALSMSDLSPFSISAYHRAKLSCITNDPALADEKLKCEGLKLSGFYPER